MIIEHLSDSRPAKLLHSVEDIPIRFTLVHAYIRAVSGYSNLTKEGRRIQFVIRVSHNIEPKDFVRSISVDLKEEIGAMCYVKNLNLTYTEFACWLKGILKTFPEAAVKDQFVTDLMVSGYAGTREDLERKMAFEKNQVWVDNAIRKREEQEFSAEAQAFIKCYSTQ